MIRIGTFNVHEWTDNSHKYSLDAIVKLIISSDLDIIGLQETSEAKLQKIKEFKMYNYVYNNTTAILSKFPIKKQKKIYENERFITAAIVLPDNLPILHVTCVHLDYEKKPIRIKEIQNIMEYIYEPTTTLPSVILGDFNSLTRKDYSTDEWNDILIKRKINMWELPVSNATEMMTKQYNWRDTRNIAQNVKSDLYTCRFYTRIDYIYINDLITKWWGVQECDHVNAIPNISDHNLVITTLDL